MELIKFPRTPHLKVLGGFQVRGDKVLSEEGLSEFLSHVIVVEEKIDGANLGVSFGPGGDIFVQNRCGYLSAFQVGQWKGLSEWLALMGDRLFDVLAGRYLLFGEWCYAQRAVAYTKLSDWFIGFDVYDREVRDFVSCCLRDELFRDAGICGVPRLARGRFSLHGLFRLLSGSKFGEGLADRLYLRVDEEGVPMSRAKLVRAGFVQKRERHWPVRNFRSNQKFCL